VSVVNNLNINILPSEPVICIGDSVQLNASGATSYSWLPNSSISSVNVPNPIVYPSSVTTYTVIGTDATGCTGTASVLIDVVTNPKMIVSKSGDVECTIQTIQLSASGTSTSYVWSPATFLSSPNSGVTNATLTQTTTFVVTGTVGSCVITDSITVGVYNNDETAIFIPNAFSPNGDGVNDCLRVLNKANFTSYYFAIYNRWGQRVFEADSPDKCWDGNFNNQPVLLDVYYYFLKAETRCGKVFKKGDITVIR
jgi:gliding motility-associated-like protein